MIKLLKYLKPYLWMIIIMAFLVAAEVRAELALPECVGNIVSKGFEQNGIEDCVPLIISEKMKDNIVNLVFSKDKNLILKSYTNLTSKNQLENYKKFNGIKVDYKTQKLYFMSNDNKNETKLLNNILLTPLTIIACERNDQIKSGIIRDTELISTQPINTQIINMDENKREKTLKILDSNVGKIEYNVLMDLIVKSIKDSYNNIGLNIEKLQNNYIKNTGIKILGYILMADIPWILNILISSVCAAGVARSLKFDIFKQVSKFSKLEIDKLTPSSLITRTTNDVTQIQYFLFFFIEAFFFAPMYGVIAFRRAYEKNIQMSWIIIVILSVMIMITSLILMLVVPKYNVVQKLIDKVNLLVRESLTGIISIRAFNAQNFEEQRFEDTNMKITKVNFFIEKIMALIDPLIFLINNIATILIVWIGYRYVMNYNLQVGDIMVYINYTMSVIFSFLMMSMVIIDFPKVYVSCKRILEVLNMRSAIVDENVSISRQHKFKGELVFNNVSFRYPDMKKNVLNDISFVAKPGKVTAIIGATGSGKSSIVNLIPRFYDVTNGEILLDGVNIKNISQHQLRDQISYTPQKGVLFKGNIETNIKYGNNDATDEEMVKAANIAQAENFINKKNGKFLFEVSQGGTNLSGGQIQRLSIARSIIKKSKIYIFDDSFSALDFKTDLTLRKALYEYIRGATIIIISQRIGTILNADQIIVLDEGKIVGKGNHKQLIKSCKQYYDMACNQLPMSLLK